MNVEKMKRLDSPERIAEYEPDTLFELMKIKGDETILDAGAGTGAFSILLSKKVSSGWVKAIDLDRELLSVIDNKIQDNNINNIETILYDSSLPVEKDTADKVFTCVVLHEVDDKERFLNQYKECLKPGGAIYIIEFTSSKRSLNDNSDAKRKFITNEKAEKLLKKCGYINVSTTKVNELIYMAVGHKEI